MWSGELSWASLDLERMIDAVGQLASKPVTIVLGDNRVRIEAAFVSTC
jgi:hypothetical protein